MTGDSGPDQKASEASLPALPASYGSHVWMLASIVAKYFLQSFLHREHYSEVPTPCYSPPFVPILFHLEAIPAPAQR